MEQAGLGVSDDWERLAMHRPKWQLAAVVVVLSCFVAWGRVALATQVMLQDGRVLKGKLGRVSGMAEQPKAISAEGGPVDLIRFLDDDLRRTFFPVRQIKDIGPDPPGESLEKFRIRQRTLQGGRGVKSVGSILRITPFDEYGRRTFSMNTVQGKVDVVQGITEITPEWTKVEGITHVWDMRMATSSIPQPILAAILARQCKKGDIEDRKKVARFYLQAERYEAAARELDALLAEHPSDAKLHQEIGQAKEAIRQMGNRRLLAELELRAKAGQHRLVLEKLKAFPSEGVSGETLQAVREMIREYENHEKVRAEVLGQFDALVEKIADKEMVQRIAPLRKEIGEELSIDTMDRMAAFREMLGDPGMQPGEKVALAITGWLLGSKGASNRLSGAVSLYEVRKLVQRYLAAGDKLSREEIRGEFQSEAVTVEQVARLIAHMKPPIETPAPANPAEPYRLEVPGLGTSPAVKYLVQLPPEYHPHRRYPTVVTLHGAGTTPEQQIDWWAGAIAEGGFRFGQASRHGYIVVAPQWTVEHQKHYGFTAREQAAVLDSLQDACRRFSIDTDRVFLSGHSMGGDAAWDIGLAYPHLWAGVIPIVAQSDRYCAFYIDNGKLVPMYFVNGGLDGNKMNANAREWDRYMTERTGYNVTVVEYLGRGHEHFSDEILRLFDWMGRLRRNPFPRQFKCATMRPWNHRFYWVELKQFPARAMVEPSDWPPPRGARPLEVEASVNKANGINITTGAGQIAVWLSPELVDFDRRATVTVNGSRLAGAARTVTPDLAVLLEDVRLRGDRQHPFWAKVESSTGRIPSKTAGALP
jgi:predicted esterase